MTSFSPGSMWISEASCKTACFISVSTMRTTGKSSAIFFVKVVTSTFSPLFVLDFILSIRSVTSVFAGHISIFGSTIPVGLTSCSAILFYDLSNSHLSGVAEA